MKKKYRLAPFIALGVCLVVLFFWVGDLFVGWENSFLDYRMRMNIAVKVAPEIAIVAVDDASLARLGRWPWRRELHARLLDRLNEAGASAVVLDILFSEPDTAHPEDDRLLGEAVARMADRVVLDFYFQQLGPRGYEQPLFPIASLSRTPHVGYGNLMPDEDGIMRRAQLTAPYDGKLYPLISLAGLSVFAKKPAEELLAAAGIRSSGPMIINYQGAAEIFPHYSFADVLEGKVEPGAFRGKLVLVGGTAVALFDVKSTPIAPNFPGVDVHANIASNILLRNCVHPAPAAYAFLAIVGFAALSGFAFGRLPPLWGGAGALGAFAGYFFFAMAIFRRSDVAVEFVAPSVSLALSYVAVLFYRFMSEEREKRWIKKAFSQYLSPRVMESILANPGKLRLGGERENLTVLFSDIRNFTAMSEAMKPEAVVDILNEYLSAMSEIVFRHDGTLNKFIGDAVMAFWGAPIAQNDHPRRAVLCAVDMMAELKRLQDKWRVEGKPVMDIGIGVNTGDMVVGNMGSKNKMDYTVIGDNVNLGSRLEGLNKEYKTHIIVSEATWRAVQDIVEARPLGAVKVKGKEKPVEIYEVTGIR